MRIPLSPYEDILMKAVLGAGNGGSVGARGGRLPAGMASMSMISARDRGAPRPRLADRSTAARGRVVVASARVPVALPLIAAGWRRWPRAMAGA